MADHNVRGITYSVTQDMVTERCCNCGVVFAMAKEFYDRCRAKPGKSFYCPAGHGQHYVGETEADKLRRERDRLKQHEAWYEQRNKELREEADRQRRRASGYKGHATRITKRAKAGVCPCCNRTFAQLARHMATQHPTFTPEAPEPPMLKVVA